MDGCQVLAIEVDDAEVTAKGDVAFDEGFWDAPEVPLQVTTPCLHVYGFRLVWIVEAFQRTTIKIYAGVGNKEVHGGVQIGEAIGGHRQALADGAAASAVVLYVVGRVWDLDPSVTGKLAQVLFPGVVGTADRQIWDTVLVEEEVGCVRADKSAVLKLGILFILFIGTRDVADTQGCQQHTNHCSINTRCKPKLSTIHSSLSFNSNYRFFRFRPQKYSLLLNGQIKTG